MPNPKLGTVTTDVARAVKIAKAGTVSFRVEKQGIVHAGVGKVSFTVDALVDNIRALMIALFGAKPEGLKGKYMKRMHISSTMGRSVEIDIMNADPTHPMFMLDEVGVDKLGLKR
jgi:large subunit ribosomal protein L1